MKRGFIKIWVCTAIPKLPSCIAFADRWTWTKGPLQSIKLAPLTTSSTSESSNVGYVTFSQHRADRRLRQLGKFCEAEIAFSHGISQGIVSFDSRDDEDSFPNQSRFGHPRRPFALFLDPGNVLILLRTRKRINESEYVYRRVGIGVFMRTAYQQAAQPPSTHVHMFKDIPFGPVGLEDERSFVTIE
jgi:hypothetical protein